MEANAGEYIRKYLHLKRFPRISLHCKLVPVQYREYEYGLFTMQSGVLKGGERGGGGGKGERAKFSSAGDTGKGGERFFVRPPLVVPRACLFFPSF